MGYNPERLFGLATSDTSRHAESFVDWDGVKKGVAVPRTKRRRGVTKALGGVLLQATKPGETPFYRTYADMPAAQRVQQALLEDGWLATIPAEKPMPRSQKPVFGKGK